MAVQGAFDPTRPNGTWRSQSDRVLYVFRLYRKLTAPALGPLSLGGSVLSPILDPIKQAARAGREFLQGALGAMQGRILVSEYRFVLILENNDFRTDMRTRFRYTRDGYFLDTPVRNARGISHIRLAGRTHRTPVFVNGVQVDGDAALKEFKELIDDYFFPRDAFSSGRSTNDFELTWIDLNAPVSAQDPFGEFEWTIHPLRGGVRIRQNAARPHQRFFEFEFAGLRSNRDQAKAEDGFLAGLTSRTLLGKLLDGLGLGFVQDALDDVFGTVDEIQAFMDDVINVVAAIQDYVAGAAQAISTTIGKVRGLILSAQEIVSRIEDGIDMAKNLPSLTAEQFDLLTRDWQGLNAGDTDKGHIAIDDMRRVQDFLRAVALQPDILAPPLSSQPQQTVTRQVEPNITLQEIALQTGNSVEDLIAVNDLQWPFLDSRVRPERQVSFAQRAIDAADAAIASADEDYALGLITHAAYLAAIELAVTKRTQGEADLEQWTAEQAINPTSPRVLYAGDYLRIPRPRPDFVPSVLNIGPALGSRITIVTGSAPNEEDRIFGVDLLLTSEGNLVFDESKRDLKLERGLQHMAYVQVRYVRLPLNTLRYAPGIGNFAQADKARWQGPGTNRLLAFAMYSTLKQDPRVLEVRDVRATTEGGTAHLYHSIELQNGRSVGDVRVPIAQ